MKNNGIALAVGLALLGLILGLFIRSAAGVFADRDRQVTVRGLAVMDVKANKVTWPIVYKVAGNDLADLYAQFERNNSIITKYLTANGITEEDYCINAPEVDDNDANNYSNSRPVNRYTFTAVITVTSEKVELVEKLINNQGQLIRQGIALSTDWNYQTIYEYTELNSIKPDMIAEATKNARAAANKFADDSGAKIGKLISASQGQFSIEDRDPYTPSIKQIRVVTSLTYAIE